MLGLLIGTAHAMAGQPGGGAQGGQGSIMNMLFLFGPIILIFYFMMIRPQQKQAKKAKALLDAVRKGDDVVTRFGVHGKVHGIADNIITLEIAENTKIKMNKDQIGFIKPATE